MQPIPDRLVVLTFDDGRRSDVELVGPLLARHGFGATFYITEGLGFEDKSRFLEWDEIRRLHDAGFEIGNHHGRHVAVDTQTREEFERDLRHMEESCIEHGIPKPVTYCYPGGHHCRTAVAALHEAGYLFARGAARRSTSTTRMAPSAAPTIPKRTTRCSSRPPASEAGRWSWATCARRYPRHATAGSR